MIFRSKPDLSTRHPMRRFFASGVARWAAGATLCLCVVAFLISGCSSSDDRIERVSDRYRTPTIPSFLTGPASVLLTNLDGFSAELVMETPGAGDKSRVTTGELLGRGGKLLFAPASKAKPKKNRAGGFLFIWDVASNTGIVLSEALQGYAPVASTARFTGISSLPSRANLPPDRIDGHPCSQEDAAVSLGDGSISGFHLWRATDAKGIPARLTPLHSSDNYSINLSKIELRPPAQALFEPPEGFTRYESLDAMMSEIVARQEGGKRNTGERLDMDTPVQGMMRRGP